MIRTFNYWFVAAPATTFIAILLAVFSVTEDGHKVKERGSEELWGKIMTVYGWAVWFALAVMLLFESWHGILEFWGREAEGAGIATICTILGAPALWGWLLGYELFMLVRKHRLGYVEHRCKYGLSKEDRIRRHRANQKKRKKRRLNRLKRSKVHVVPSSTEAQSAPNVKVVRRDINFRLEQRIREYRIEERTDLGSTFMDSDGKHPISELLPADVRKYYVAINTKSEEAAPTFLGWEDAEANLRRFVAELLEIEDAETRAHEAVIG